MNKNKLLYSLLQRLKILFLFLYHKYVIIKIK